MKKDLKIQSCKFVELSSLVPKEWTGWFYTAISENAPFTWGDNNRSLVDAQSFANHIDEVFSYFDVEETVAEIEKHQDAFYDTLNYLGSHKVYIDLEN